MLGLIGTLAALAVYALAGAAVARMFILAYGDGDFKRNRTETIVAAILWPMVLALVIAEAVCSAAAERAGRRRK